MKKSAQRLSLLLVFVLLLTSALAVSAQDGGEADGPVVTNYVYVRYLPDVKSDYVVQLGPDTAVTIMGVTADGGWLYIEADESGEAGWVRINAITFTDDVADLPVVDAPARDQAVVLRFVNLRSLPTIDSSTVVRLESGDVVTLLAQTSNGEWLYVASADGAMGWANPRAFQYTREDGDDVVSIPELPAFNAAVSGYVNLRVLPNIYAASVGRQEPGSPVTTLAISEDEAYIQAEAYNGDMGWGRVRDFVIVDGGDDLPVIAYVESSAAVNQFATLRATADLGSADVGTLPAGALVDVRLADGDRVFVEAPAQGLAGWVYASALSFMTEDGSMPALTAVNATIVATTDAVNFRAAPSLDAVTLGSGVNGQRVQVIAQSADGAWYQIIPPSRQAAWVFGDLVTLDNPGLALAVAE